MEAYVLLTIIDFAIFYVTFSFQRATLDFARSHSRDQKEIINIQVSLSPAIFGAVAWLNWLTLIVALVLLFRVHWWYPLAYLILRFVFSGLLPTFSFVWAPFIRSRLNKLD